MNGAEVLTKFTADTSGVDKATKNTSASLGKLTTAFALGNVAVSAINKTMQIFSSNLDSAISRYDTMNNFPRVMQNLGISADEANEVIQSLSEELTGLPTSLDAGARAVQRFTTVNGDIKQSEKLFVAVNNAILAGGANADIQANALEQLSQAYSKGKPDMMEWRTMLTAMPAQLKQVATAMNMTTDQLGAGLRDGSISMNDFMNTIVELNTTGVGEFASFEEQARTATGGINTAIKNMKTATVRGITTMISKVDEAMKPYGGLSGVISKLGKIAEKIFSKIGDAIAKVIPKISALVNWFKENKVVLGILVGIIGTVIAILKTYQTIMTVINTIQAIHNALLLANPAVLIISAIIVAIAAVIAIVILLWNKCEWFRNLVMIIFDAIKTGIQAVIDFLQPLIDFIVAAFKLWWEIFSTFWTNVFGFLITVGTWIYDNVIAPVVDFIKNAFILWLAIFTTFWGTIYNVLSTVASWIYDNVLSPVFNFFKNIFTNIWNIISKVIDKIKNAFSSVKDFIIKAFEVVKGTITHLFEAIGNVIKTPINGIVSGMNKVIDMINSLKVPDWVPGIGGKSPNFKRIPYLATGTNYVPEDTLAMIHQGEAVIPKKFNPYANGLDNSTIGTMLAGKQQIIVNVNNDIELDPLGQVVSKIKTFSGGAKSDYNYGMGGSRIV